MFLCHIRHLNPINKDAQITKNIDKLMLLNVIIKKENHMKLLLVENQDKTKSQGGKSQGDKSQFDK